MLIPQSYPLFAIDPSVLVAPVGSESPDTRPAQVRDAQRRVVAWVVDEKLVPPIPVLAGVGPVVGAIIAGDVIELVRVVLDDESKKPKKPGGKS